MITLAILIEYISVEDIRTDVGRQRYHATHRVTL